MAENRPDDLLPTKEEILERAQELQRLEVKIRNRKEDIDDLVDFDTEEEDSFSEESEDENSVDLVEEEEGKEINKTPKNTKAVVKFSPRKLFKENLLPLIAKRTADLNNQIRNMEFGQKVADWLQNNARHMNGHGYFEDISFNSHIQRGHFNTRHMDVDQSNASSSSVNTTAYILANRGKGAAKSRYRTVKIREYCFVEQETEFMEFGKNQLSHLYRNQPEKMMPLELYAPQRLPAIQDVSRNKNLAYSKSYLNDGMRREKSPLKRALPTPIKEEEEEEYTESIVISDSEEEEEEQEIFLPKAKSPRVEKKRTGNTSSKTTLRNNSDKEQATSKSRNEKKRPKSKKIFESTSDSDSEEYVPTPARSKRLPDYRINNKKPIWDRDTNSDEEQELSKKMNNEPKKNIVKHQNEIVIYEPRSTKISKYDRVQITNNLLVEKLGSEMGSIANLWSYLKKPMAASSKLVYCPTSKSLKEYIGDVHNIDEDSDETTDEEVLGGSAKETPVEHEHIVLYAPSSKGNKSTGNIRIDVKLLEKKLPRDVARNLKDHPVLKYGFPASSTLLYNPASKKLYERF